MTHPAIEVRLNTGERQCPGCGVPVSPGHGKKCWHCFVDLDAAADVETGLAATLAERGKQHGDFRNHAFYTDELKKTLRCGVRWDALTPSQREALDMIVHKIGRVLAGDPNHVDHWHDIAGYATLVERQLSPEAR